jgi:hypothetical protein
MRGAGTADHTGDGSTSSKRNGSSYMDPAIEKEELRRTMCTCAISGQPLQFGNETTTIVTCPYGRLYHKEAAIEALIQRKQQQKEDPSERESSASNNGSLIGSHVRGLKDLKEVRFHLIPVSNNNDTTTADGTPTNNTTQPQQFVPACPIRGNELNGQIPAVVLLPGGTINVVSERAWKEMKEEVIAEYGPVEKVLKLAPSRTQLKEIQEEYQKQVEEEKNHKKLHKKKSSKRRKGEEEKGGGTIVSKVPKT